MVNRIWQHHFGYGLVRLADNFGKMGERPTHPELLDYLAGGSFDSGWSVKAMHRMMLLSERLPDVEHSRTPQPRRLDPENKLLQPYAGAPSGGGSDSRTILSISGTLE